VLVIAFASTTAAAQAPSAATVLANVQQFYAKTKQLTATFRQTVTLATYNTSNTSDGHLWVLKPSDVRADYVVKRHGAVVITKSFVFDGATLWLVDHDNKQLVQMPAQSSALPAAVSFVTGGTALASQFAAVVVGSGKFGTKQTVVLRLTPKQPSAACKELFLVVEPADWHVKESIVINSNGDENHFWFFAPNLAATVKPSLFQVNPSALPTYKLVQPKQPVVAAPAAPSPSP
jgi:outer membrane lipoprotein-sorting protein